MSRRRQRQPQRREALIYYHAWQPSPSLGARGSAGRTELVRPVQLAELAAALAALDREPSRVALARAGRLADDLTSMVKASGLIDVEFAERGPELLNRLERWAETIATAYHEAGHVVTAWALGRRVERATIVPDERSSGAIVFLPRASSTETAADVAAIAAIVDCAGSLAEAMLWRRTPGMLARKAFGAVGSRSRSDRAASTTTAHAYAFGRAAIGEAILAAWRNRAADILSRYKLQLELVAHELLEQRTLDADALRDVLGPIEAFTDEEEESCLVA